VFPVLVVFPLYIATKDVATTYIKVTIPPKTKNIIDFGGVYFRL
jgi:hypothetical protein